MGHLHGFDVGLDRRTAQLAQVRESVVVDLSAALAQEQPEQREEALAAADTEQLQDIPRVEAVDPFAEEFGHLAFRQ